MPVLHRKRRIGVISTLVWDVIYGQPPHDDPVEGWGGVSYTLSGLDAALEPSWEIIPLIKVGHDLIDRAREFLGTLRRVAPDAELIEVPEKNNRSELRYYSDERRSEFLSGGVPGWTWEELRERLDAARVEALYVNFLSGWEMDLATARTLRAQFDGPIYSDIHMMAWAVLPSGLRTLRPIEHAAAWCGCFDFIQVNEDEMPMLSTDARSLAHMASAHGARCTVVTLGRKGVIYFASPDVSDLMEKSNARRAGVSPGVLRTAILAPEAVREGPGVDPTGCGDVWGSTYFSRLLAGDDMSDAMRAANRAAGRNVERRGVVGLADYLRADNHS
ncbi:MAG: carbohydrate kinase family protein [Gemmatimonadaceae bacterium]